MQNLSSTTVKNKVLLKSRPSSYCADPGNSSDWDDQDPQLTKKQGGSNWKQEEGTPSTRSEPASSSGRQEDSAPAKPSSGESS